MIEVWIKLSKTKQLNIVEYWKKRLSWGWQRWRLLGSDYRGWVVKVVILLIHRISFLQKKYCWNNIVTKQIYWRVRFPKNLNSFDIQLSTSDIHINPLSNFNLFCITIAHIIWFSLSSPWKSHVSFLYNFDSAIRLWIPIDE